MSWLRRRPRQQPPRLDQSARCQACASPLDPTSLWHGEPSCHACERQRTAQADDFAAYLSEQERALPVEAEPLAARPSYRRGRVSPLAERLA